jgi:two-component system, response regulator PdtaR
MPRYFFDLDDGKTNYVDAVGSEVADPGTIQGEAISFLASVFRDAAHEDSNRAFLVRVRNAADQIVFTTTLTLRSEWCDERHHNGTGTVKRPVVLIVEDEFLSRTNAAEMISNHGFDVVEAENADLAIAILETRPDVQVVFTDIRLPGSMDGLKFAKYVKAKWPPIRIIATSEHVVVREGDLPDGGVFLPKPYTAGHIAAALQACTATV